MRNLKGKHPLSDDIGWFRIVFHQNKKSVLLVSVFCFLRFFVLYPLTSLHLDASLSKFILVIHSCLNAIFRILCPLVGDFVCRYDMNNVNGE